LERTGARPVQKQTAPRLPSEGRRSIKLPSGLRFAAPSSSRYLRSPFVQSHCVTGSPPSEREPPSRRGLVQGRRRALPPRAVTRGSSPERPIPRSSTSVAGFACRVLRGCGRLPRSILKYRTRSTWKQQRLFRLSADDRPSPRRARQDGENAVLTQRVMARTRRTHPCGLPHRGTSESRPFCTR